jgi:O-antigen ligase
VAVLVFAGSVMLQRFSSISTGEGSAYGSYVERQILIMRAFDAIINYPLLGVGTQNFTAYSGVWRNVHVSYLQIAAEGGIPALILYILFFHRGFANLRRLVKTENLDEETKLFAAASRASLIGFLVGASFGPEAYQFFPYFAVCYTSVMVAMVEERRSVVAPTLPDPALSPHRRYADFFLHRGRPRAYNPAH